jgi:AcrR family transcriptional regulator
VDHEQRRREISAVTLEIVASEGVGAVTFRSVAEASGWSTGVLMHYFKNRQGMLLEALRFAVNEASRSQREILRDLAGVEALIAILEDPLPVDRQRLALSRVFTFFYAEAVSDEEMAAEVDSYTRRWRRAAEHAVVAAQARGELDPTQDPAQLAAFAVAFADGLALHSLLNDEVRDFVTNASPVRRWVDALRVPAAKADGATRRAPRRSARSSVKA